MEVILKSEAVLLGRKGLSLDIKNRVDELIFRFQSVIKAKNTKYIMLHIDKSNVNKLKNLLPGCEAPTILALDGYPDKVAVHVVTEENVFWDTISKLKSIGATSILSVAIEKMME